MLCMSGIARFSQKLTFQSGSLLDLIWDRFFLLYVKKQTNRKQVVIWRVREGRQRLPVSLCLWSGSPAISGALHCSLSYVAITDCWWGLQLWLVAPVMKSGTWLPGLCAIWVNWSCCKFAAAHCCYCYRFLYHFEMHLSLLKKLITFCIKEALNIHQQVSSIISNHIQTSNWFPITVVYHVMCPAWQERWGLYFINVLIITLKNSNLSVK